MDNLFTVFFVSFFVTYVSIPVIIRIADIKKLVDVPDSRKIHKRPTPSLGGFGIFAGFVLALLVSVPFSAAAGMQYFIAAAFLIYLVGLKDDVQLMKLEILGSSGECTVSEGILYRLYHAVECIVIWGRA